MNFLAHYQSAKQKLDNPFYCLGLIYPDLPKNRRNYDFDNVKLNVGIIEHNELDKIFHNSEWFGKSLQYIGRKFETRGFSAHVTVEFAIDYLLSNQMINDGSIDSVEEMLASDKLHQFYKNESPEIESYVDNLVNRKVLRSYQDSGAVFARLNRLINLADERKGNVEEEVFLAATEYIRLNPWKI